MSDGQKAAEDGNAKARSFKDLLVWQKGMALAKGVYGITRQLEQVEEAFHLISDLRNMSNDLRRTLSRNGT
jgi:hypothetical protein